MNSFYGGKQGRTYHIVARYDEIYINESDPEILNFNSETQYTYGDRFRYQTKIYKVLADKVKLTEQDLAQNNDKVTVIRGMVNEFKKGGSYTEANYGEYVIIDTILNQNHRNDDINGLLYRRGFDYTEEPAAERPDKEAVQERNITDIIDDEPYTLENVSVKVFYNYGLIKVGEEIKPLNKGLNHEKWTAAWRKYVTRPGGGAIYVGHIVGPQGDAPELRGVSWKDFQRKMEEAGEDIDKGKIVPPSETKGVQRIDDQVVYADNIGFGYCNIKEGDGDLIGCYISFDIPSPVVAVTAQSVDAYGDEVRQHTDEYSSEVDEVGINAEYDSDTKKWKYSNLIHRHSESEKHPFYFNFDIAVPQGIRGTDLESIQIEDLTGIEDFDGQYFTYYTRDYLESSNGDVSERRNQWPYRVIKQIITGLKEREYFFNSLSTWQANRQDVSLGDLVSINKTNGKFLICIKKGRTGSLDDFEPSIPTVQSPIGSVFKSGSSIWRVIEIPEEAADKIIVEYTQGSNSDLSIRLIDYLSMADNGDLYVTYTDSDEKYFISNIAGIKNINLTDTHLVINFNNGESTSFEFKQIEDIRFNDTNIFIEDGQEITDLHRPTFQLKYKGDSEWNKISNPINTVLAIDKIGDIVIAFYADPQFRRNFAATHEENVQWFKRPYIDYAGNIHNNQIWIALGDVEGFIHIYGDFESLAKLQEQFPDGFAGAYADRAGWAATVRENNGYSLYAYNYNSTTPDWYKIKDMADNMIDPTLSIRVSTEIESSQDSYYQQDNLNLNGVWFVITDGHHS